MKTTQEQRDDLRRLVKQGCRTYTSYQVSALVDDADEAAELRTGLKALRRNIAANRNYTKTDAIEDIESLLGDDDED